MRPTPAMDARERSSEYRSMGNAGCWINPTGYSWPIDARSRRRQRPPLLASAYVVVVVRRAAKIDSNQQAIVDALRACGAAVQSLAGVGKGCPDLLAYRAGKYYLIECKAGSGFTPAQKRWHKEWPGPAYVANSVADAMLIVGAVDGGRLDQG